MTDPDEASDRTARWPLLGLGGAVSLCCVFAAPSASSAVTTAAAGGAAAGGAAAGTGADAVRIVVTALAVGLLVFVVRRRTDASSDE